MMQTSAFEAIFASIRSGLEASRPFDRALAEGELPWRPAVDNYTLDEAAERFRLEFEAVGGVFHRVARRGDVVAVLQDIARETGARTAAISDPLLVRQAAGEVFDIVENAGKTDLFAADAGITEAQFGIAETGTLVLCSGAERNRLASLVPPVHICILRLGHTRMVMSEILASAYPLKNAAITFITGASRTSDIELTLALGVHGPKKLYVILLEEGEDAV